MSVKLTTRQVGDVTVVDAAGRITLGEGASMFRDTIRDLAAAGHKKHYLFLIPTSHGANRDLGRVSPGRLTVSIWAGQALAFRRRLQLGAPPSKLEGWENIGAARTRYTKYTCTWCGRRSTERLCWQGRQRRE